MRKPAGSAHKRLYAIGDIHGRYDLLIRLLEMIHDHNCARPRLPTSIVMLGDLIDRGPDSRRVLELLRLAQPDDYRLYALMGNHEEMMLKAVGGDLNALTAWRRFGGNATAISYGVPAGLAEGGEALELHYRLASSVPQSHLQLMRSFSDSIRFGDYLLVHAGVRPGAALQDQTAEDLRWIREPFLGSRIDHGYMVVHGHSQSLEIEEYSNRIGIDTGAYRTGVLTAIWIEGEERGFLQARGRPAD